MDREAFIPAGFPQAWQLRPRHAADASPALFERAASDRGPKASSVAESRQPPFGTMR
jgi:hypothetical protein